MLKLYDVNSNSIGTAVRFVAHSTDAILCVGWDVVNQFGQCLTGGCFEDCCAVLQQNIIDAGLCALNRLDAFR